MIDSGGVNVATLGIKVTNDGVKESADGLDALTGSSEQAEKATKTLTVAEAARAEKLGLLATLEREYNVVITGGSATKDASRAMLVAHARALADDEARTRSLALAQLQAIEMDKARAASSEAAATATGAHGLQLGRLNMEMGTFAGRILGVNTAATRLTAMIGGNVAGYGQMIVAMLAIDAGLVIWSRLTNHTKAARQEQDELTKSAEKYYETTSRLGGERQRTLEAEIQKLADVQKAYDEAEKARHGAGIGGLRGFGQEIVGGINVLLGRGTPQELRRTGGAVDAAQQAVTDKALKDQAEDLVKLIQLHQANTSQLALAREMLASYTDALAKNVTIGAQHVALTMGQRAEYAELAKSLREAFPKQTATEKSAFAQGTQFEDTVAKYKAETASLLEENAARDKGVASLDAWSIANAGALAVAELLRKQHDIERQALERHQTLTEAETKAFAAQIPVVRDAAEAHEAAVVAVRHHTEAVSHIQELRDRADAITLENDALKQGEATRETYAVQQQFQIELAKANREATLDDMVAHIAAAQAVRDAALAHISIADAIKAEAEALKKAQAVEERSITTMLKEMQHGLTGFFDNVLTKGIASFRDLFSEIKNMWLKLLADMAAADIMRRVSMSGVFGSVASGAAHGAASRGGETAGIAGLGASMVGAAGEALGIGAAGFGVGSLIGGMTTNSALGALGGAAGGAATGAAIGAAGGPIGVAVGAFIGGAAGAVGGFLSARHAAEAAAEALLKVKMAEAQIGATLADWRAQITGTAVDQKAAAEADLKWKYLSIRQTIEQAEAGKAQEEQRNKDLAEADRLYADAQKGLTDSTNALTASMLNAVSGYKYQAAIFAAAPFGAPPSGAGASGTSGTTSSGVAGGRGDGALTVTVVLGDGTVLGKAVLADFKRRAQRQFGDTTQWARVQ